MQPTDQSAERNNERGCSVFSLVVFWVLISLLCCMSSQTWTNNWLVHWLCCGSEGERGKIECSSEVRICRAAIKACLEFCYRLWAMSSFFFPLCFHHVLYVYMMQDLLYGELDKLYIYSSRSKTVMHSILQVLKSITEKTVNKTPAIFKHSGLVVSNSCSYWVTNLSGYTLEDLATKNEMKRKKSSE